MSKAILLSDKPKWIVKIVNGKKTLEVRNEFPSDYVGWVYLYCTKARHYTDLLINNVSQKRIFLNTMKAFWLDDFSRFEHLKMLNGKVVARFWCDKVEEIFSYLDTSIKFYEEPRFKTKTLTCYELVKKSCLWGEELFSYLTKRKGYAIHISKLEIFDEPKELSEFKTLKSIKQYKKDLEVAEKEDLKIREQIMNDVVNFGESDHIANCVECVEYAYQFGAYGLKKAPRNYCYIEVEE